MTLALAAPDLFGVPLADTITRDADLSRCGAFRWTLTRSWSSEGGRVCFIGLNPSTADHCRDDPTVLRWIHFARAWGYGGFVAVNLYPFRSSSPADARAWANWQENGPDYYARDRLWENETVLVREAKAAALVVPCWGAGVWDPMYVDHVLEMIQEGEAPWPDLHCLGLTASGDPKHPMARGRSRIPDHTRPALWRAGSSSSEAAQ